MSPSVLLARAVLHTPPGHARHPANLDLLMHIHPLVGRHVAHARPARSLALLAGCAFSLAVTGHAGAKAPSPTARS